MRATWASDHDESRYYTRKRADPLFRTENIAVIRQNMAALGYAVEEDIHLNANSSKMEFSLRDPDGYYLTISEFHRYEG
jgi:hypothetical protein